MQQRGKCHCGDWRQLLGQCATSEKGETGETGEEVLSFRNFVSRLSRQSRVSCSILKSEEGGYADKEESEKIQDR